MAAHLGSNNARGIEVWDATHGAFAGSLQISSGRTGFVYKEAFRLPASGGASGVVRAQAVANELNLIFGDTSYDADFITPSWFDPGNYVRWPDGAYSVVFEKIKAGEAGCTTSFGSGATVNECLYSGCQYRLSPCRPGLTDYAHRDKAVYQQNLIFIATEDRTWYSNDVQWDLALYFANQIRGLIEAWDSRDRPLPALVTNGLQYYTGSTLNLTATMYGLGETLPNEWTACFGGAENLHTADLTVATDRASLACNMWMKITDPSNGRNIAVRATDDTAPNSNTIDLTSGGVAHYFIRGTPQDGCRTFSVQVSPL